jgi:hypothetical protein
MNQLCVVWGLLSLWLQIHLEADSGMLSFVDRNKNFSQESAFSWVNF